MRLAVAVFLCSWCYTTCSGQTDVPAEPGIAVNGKPMLAGELEKGHKFYEYYFQDQEILSFNVINNETYELTDCFEESRDPCWLPEGRMFLKERPEQTYCCVARHQDPARTTRLSVSVKFHDENTAEIRLWQTDWQRRTGCCTCDADKQVVARAFRVSVKLPRPQDFVASIRCQDAARSGDDKTDAIVSQNFTKESSKYFVAFPNFTFNEKGRWTLRCTFYKTPCRYIDLNKRTDDSPGCWVSKWRNFRQEDEDGVSCNVTVDVIGREDVLSPAGFLAINKTQFSTARTHVYYFTEGEQATFYCNRTVDGFAQLTYTDNAGNETSTQFHQQGKAVALTLQLTAGASHSTVLECTVADVMYEDYLRIRVRLLAKPEDHADP